jgi:hypothetical protein
MSVAMPLSVMRGDAACYQNGALVAGVSLSLPSLLQGWPLGIHRAVLTRVQPAPALRCPQGAVFNMAPVQPHKMAPSCGVEAGRTAIGASRPLPRVLGSVP